MAEGSSKWLRKRSRLFRTKNAVLKLSQQTAEFKEAFSFFFRQRWRQHFDHQGVGHSHAILDQNPTEAQL